MKSQIYVFIVALLPLVGDVIKAQPRLSIDMGIGFYEPTLVGFDENETVQFPTKSIFNRNMLSLTGVSIMSFLIMRELDIIPLHLMKLVKIYF